MSDHENRDRPTAGKVEERTAALEVATEGRKIRGLVPYGVESRDLGGWTEVIDAGALRSTNLDELVARVDHAGVPIGRHPATLELEDRSDGLAWAVTPPQSRADLIEAVERGDLRSGSLADGGRQGSLGGRPAPRRADQRTSGRVGRDQSRVPASEVEYRAASTATERTTCPRTAPLRCPPRRRAPRTRTKPRAGGPRSAPSSHRHAAGRGSGSASRARIGERVPGPRLSG